MLDVLTNYATDYYQRLINQPLWKLPIAPLDAAAQTLVYTTADYLYTPPVPETPQGRFTPAAPRSQAELTSGMWSPEDAITFGQRETVEEVIRQNDARANGLYVASPTPPPPESDSHTLEWVLFGVAVTGIGIAILGRKS